MKGRPWRRLAKTPLLNRRSTMALGALSAAPVLGNLGGAARAQGSGGVKLTVLYAPQKDPNAFTKYYLSKHMPIVDKVPGVKKTEVATVLPAPNPPAPPYYRITKSISRTLKQSRRHSPRRNGMRCVRTRRTSWSRALLRPLRRRSALRSSAPIAPQKLSPQLSGSCTPANRRGALS
jgi:hypothetical protein